MMTDVTCDGETQGRTDSQVLKKFQAEGPEKILGEENDCRERETCVEPIKLRRFISSNCIDVFLKVCFVFLSIPWFISTVFFSIFDTKCIVFEKASVINCSQGFFISNPRHWVLAWLLMSNISTFILMLIIALNHKKLNYQIGKAKKIYQKGYVGSFIFLLFISLAYLVVRIYSISTEKTSVSTQVLLCLWHIVTVLLVCCFNYLPRVHWRTSNQPRYTLAWWKHCLASNSNFFIYWLALLIYFVDITSKVTAIMLDVAHDVAPLIQSKYPEQTGQFWGVMVIVIGFRLAFHLRVLSFYWQKLFHGDKDLFTEPNQKLIEEPMVEQQDDESENAIKLEEVICTSTNA